MPVKAQVLRIGSDLNSVEVYDKWTVPTGAPPSWASTTTLAFFAHASAQHVGATTPFPVKTTWQSSQEL